MTQQQSCIAHRAELAYIIPDQAIHDSSLVGATHCLFADYD